MPEETANESVNPRPENENPPEIIPPAESSEDLSLARVSNSPHEPAHAAQQPESEPSLLPAAQALSRPPRRKLSAREIEQRRNAALQSTGPRTPEGKARSRTNAVKDGVSGLARFLWDSMIAMGENPEEFQHLFGVLITSLQPVGGAEMLLVEDIAMLSWKKARLDRVQQGVWERQMELLELERRRRSFEADLMSADNCSPEQLRESGLRGLPDSPGKFEEMLSIVEILMGRVGRKDFSENLSEAMAMLYGEKPTVRGKYIAGSFHSFSEASARGEHIDRRDSSYIALVKALNEEFRDVSEQYQVYLQDKVEVSRARRHAALAPEGGAWPTMVRMENYLHRHIERKMKLLMQVQRTRRKLERQLEEAKQAATRGKFAEPLSPEKNKDVIFSQNEPEKLLRINKTPQKSAKTNRKKTLKRRNAKSATH
jgi:hypothetical protein